MRCRTKEQDVHLPVEPRACLFNRDRVCLQTVGRERSREREPEMERERARERARERGRERSEGAQVIEVSPPFLFFSGLSHPSLRPPPPTTTLSTQRAQLCSPHPTSWPLILHFSLNATLGGLSLLTPRPTVPPHTKLNITRRRESSTFYT